MKKTLLLLSSIISFNLLADNYDEVLNNGYYVCTVMEANSVDKLKFDRPDKRDNEISLSTHNEFVRQSIGKEFIVDIKDGVVNGYFDNDYHFTPKVLAYGSNSNSYHSVSSIAHDNGNASMYYLTVQQFREGDLKPFHYVIGTYSLMGTCKLK